MTIGKRIKKRILLCFVALASVFCAFGSLTTPVHAETDTGRYTLTWYNNNTWLEGWSTWTYGWGQPTSTDWIWLEKTGVAENGNVTYKTYAGWNASNGNWWAYGGWKYTYNFYVNGAHVSSVPAPSPGTNLTWSFNGTCVERVGGGSFTVSQGSNVTVYFEVKNGHNTTVSSGSINFNVPIYKIPEHKLAFDTQGGDIPDAKPTSTSTKNLVYPDSGYYYLQASKDTNKYLHVVNQSTAEQTQVNLWETANETTTQARWYLERYNNTQYYTIQNDKSSMYLSGGQSGSVDSMQVARIKYQKTLSGNVITGNIGSEALADNQLWFFTENEDGTIAIHNKQNPNMVLDMLGYSWDNGTMVGFYPYNEADNQKWNLVKCGENKNYATKKKRMNQYQFIPTTVPVKDGYKFLNWNTEPNGSGTKYVAGQNYTHDQDGGTKTLYARWERAEYDVNYKGNGGTYNGTDTFTNKATFGENYTVKENMFSKTGYEFVGWNTKADGTGTDWTGRINKPFKWTYDYGVTLYAQWKPITYTVVFNGNGHTTGIMKDQTLTYDKAEQLYKNTYKKDNADWIEWNTKPDGSGKSYKDQQQVKNLTSKKGEIITLYAIWDNVPVLETIDNAYMKDETVTIEKVIKDNATADDVEDGNLDDKIKVEKIEYPDGTIVKNPGKNTELNTNWEDKVSIEITFTVTDTYGHKVTNTSIITIIPGQYPDKNPPVDVDGKKPKLYNRYIHKGYEWSLDGNSVWSQNEEYRNELNEVLNNLE